MFNSGKRNRYFQLAAVRHITFVGARHQRNALALDCCLLVPGLCLPVKVLRAAIYDGDKDLKLSVLCALYSNPAISRQLSTCRTSPNLVI